MGEQKGRHVRIGVLSLAEFDDDGKCEVQSLDADLQQIRKDVPRSFPGEAAVESHSHLIEAILMDHAKFDPELGYCQGMNCVAAVVAAQICELSAATTFFRRLVDNLRGLWLPGFPLLTSGAVAFDALQRAELPHLHQRLLDLGASPDMFLPDVWLTLFARWLPFASLWTVLTFLEREGLAGLLGLTAAVLSRHEAALLAAEDFTAIFVMLKTLGRQPEQPDIGALIGDARQLLQLARSFIPRPRRQVLPGGSTLLASSSSLSERGNFEFVRRGSRVFHARSNLEAVPDDWEQETLQRLAMRTMSMTVMSPSRMHSLPSRVPSTTTITPTCKAPWRSGSASPGSWAFCSCNAAYSGDEIEVIPPREGL